MRDATSHHEELPVILPLIGIMVGTLPALLKSAFASGKERPRHDTPDDRPTEDN